MLYGMNKINNKNMNEIDLKTKIEGLKKAIEEHKGSATTYESELKAVEQELKDYNKPELTGSQLDDIQEVIEEAVGNYDFDDVENYSPEYELDYDGRVTCSSFNFENYNLIEQIVKKVHKLFKEVPSNEEGEADNS